MSSESSAVARNLVILLPLQRAATIRGSIGCSCRTSHGLPGLFQGSACGLSIAPISLFGVSASVGIAALSPSCRRHRAVRIRRGITRSSSLPGRTTQLLTELYGLKTRSLKQRLEEMGLCTDGCVDRESLLELLESSSSSLPLSQCDAKEEVVPVEAQTVNGGVEMRSDESQMANDRLVELRALRARELQRELGALGVRTDNCVDKESLLELLETAGAAALKDGIGGSVRIPIFMLPTPDQLGIKMDGKHITVDLALGNLLYRFVMDTGASHTLMMDSMAGSLQSADLGMSAWATGAMGVQHGMRLVSVPQAQLGSLRCGPLQLVLTPQPLPIPFGVAGILGLDFIMRFNWDIDVISGRARVVLPPPGGGPVPFELAGMREIPLARFRAVGPEVLTATVKIRRGRGSEGTVSVTCVGVIDLGAVTTLCNTAAVRALGLGPNELHDSGAVVSGVGGSPVRVLETSVAISIGDGPDGSVETNAMVTVGDLPFFTQLGLDACGPVVLLGLDVLGRSRLVLSAQAGRLWLPA